MADHSLHPLCALGGTEPVSHVVASARITENPALAMASLAARHGREATLAASAAGLIGAPLPGPGGMAGEGHWAAFWTSPGQWMLTAPFASHEDIAAIVKAAVGADGSVTEQTDGWVRFEVEGAGVVAMLQRLCNVDVDAMQAGQATRSQIEHLGTFVLCHRARTAFSLITLRSGAASMLHALETAARAVA